jgi:hypothetical protein
MQEDELIQQGERLERGNRRWKLALLVLLLSCLVLLLAGFDYPQPNLVKARSVEAQNFILRDADGHILRRLAISDDGPRLTFFGRARKYNHLAPVEARDAASAVESDTYKAKGPLSQAFARYSALTDAPSAPPLSAG